MFFPNPLTPVVQQDPNSQPALQGQFSSGPDSPDARSPGRPSSRPLGGPRPRHSIRWVGSAPPLTRTPRRDQALVDRSPPAVVPAGQADSRRLSGVRLHSTRWPAPLGPQVGPL